MIVKGKKGSGDSDTPLYKMGPTQNRGVPDKGNVDRRRTTAPDDTVHSLVSTGLSY